MAERPLVERLRDVEDWTQASVAACFRDMKALLMEAAERINNLEQSRPSSDYVSMRPIACKKQVVSRIRHALQFGQHVSHADNVALFEAVTGERIEVGRRCETCGGEGERMNHMIRLNVPCTDCQGSGYSVRPSWMEEAK